MSTKSVFRADFLASMDEDFVRVEETVPERGNDDTVDDIEIYWRLLGERLPGERSVHGGCGQACCIMVLRN